MKTHMRSKVKFLTGMLLCDFDFIIWNSRADSACTRARYQHAMQLARHSTYREALNNADLSLDCANARKNCAQVWVTLRVNKETERTHDEHNEIDIGEIR
jgi:hypothetical protein